MTNTKLLLAALLFLCNFAYASDLFIKLGATTSTSQVKQIEKIVKERGYSLHIQEDKERYRLYVGAFSNQAKALEALQSLQGTFPSAVAVKLHSTNFTQTQNRPQKEREGSSTKKSATENASSNERPFFVQFALGFHNTASEISGDITPQELSASGMSYGVGIGYMFNSRFWGSGHYDILGTESVSISNIYATLNYSFWQTQDFSVFAGGLVGFSSLSWDTPPQTGAETTGPSSFFLGAQLGAYYPFGVEGLSVFSSYSLTSFNLKTSIAEGSDTTGAIEQSMTHKIQVGLQYNF